MGYVLGLFLVLAVMFYGVTGTNVVSNLGDQIKDRANTALFPKTEKEILVDNLQEQKNLLDRFFSKTAPDLLGSDTVSEEDKDRLIEAMQAFSESEDIIDKLGTLEKEDKSVTKALLQKAFNLNKDEDMPEPTYIPPQCELICEE